MPVTQGFPLHCSTDSRSGRRKCRTVPPVPPRCQRRTCRRQGKGRLSSSVERKPLDVSLQQLFPTRAGTHQCTGFGSVSLSVPPKPCSTHGIKGGYSQSGPSKRPWEPRLFRSKNFLRGPHKNPTTFRPGLSSGPPVPYNPH